MMMIMYDSYEFLTRELAWCKRQSARCYRTARREAESAERSYGQAAEDAKWATWLARRPDLQDELGTPADYDRWQASKLRYANRCVEWSFTNTDRARDYARQAREYQARLDALNARVAAYRAELAAEEAASSAATVEAGHDPRCDYASCLTCFPPAEPSQDDEEDHCGLDVPHPPHDFCGTYQCSGTTIDEAVAGDEAFLAAFPATPWPVPKPVYCTCGGQPGKHTRRCPITLADRSRACYIDHSRGSGPDEVTSMYGIRRMVAERGWTDEIDLFAKLAIQAEVPNCLAFS